MRDFERRANALRQRFARLVPETRRRELSADRTRLEDAATSPELWGDPASARNTLDALAVAADRADAIAWVEQAINDLDQLIDLGQDGDESQSSEIEGLLAAISAALGRLA